MKGLIIKDLFLLRKQGKILLLLAVFYTAFSIFTKNISMLGAVVAMMCVMMPITTLSYDEYCKWDRYALAMPVSGKMIVLSKYVLGLLLTLAGSILACVFSVGIVAVTGEKPFGEALLTIFCTSMASLLFLSVILPILFKFGVEKGRILLMLVIFIPAALIYLLYKLGFQIPDGETLKLLAWLSPIAVTLIGFLSVWLSISIYRKKEF